MRRLFAYFSALLVLCACTSTLEKEWSRMDASLEGKPVTITFSVPNVKLASPTKTFEDGDGLITDDSYLDPDKFYLIVCGSTQSIKYIRKAEVVVDDVTGEPVTTEVPVSSIPDYPLTDGDPKVDLISFSVQLELSDSHRTIYFLGNIDESQLITGSYSYQVLPSLFSYVGKQAYWQSVSLEAIRPLMNEHNQPAIENGSYLPDKDTEDALSYVPLIRNYAKIQVTDATADEDEFELYSYAVIHYPKKGTVAPFRTNSGDIQDAFNFNPLGDNYRFSGYERCSFGNLDEDINYPGYLALGVEFDHTIPTDDMFRDPENSDGRVLRYDPNDKDRGFYIYERGVPSASLEPTFVIIRGRFGDKGAYYYYRLDLMETKTVNYESVYQYYPIFRNFRYNIQLNRISSVGVSTPEAAANSSGAEDISADISMRHLSDISNGQTRLVVEPFMSRTYTSPNEEGYYYLYARFFNDLNSSEPNVDWGAVSVELEPMEDLSEDILVLYDDVGNEVHAFYPTAQQMDGVNGFRVIRFNTKAAGTETKTQKIKITGRNLYTHEEYPLYREVEISLQKKQTMNVKCVTEKMAILKGAKQEIQISIPSGLPESMFPLEFTIEAERQTLTPDNEADDNNLPVVSGISISDNPEYEGKTAFQFVRTISLQDYLALEDVDGWRTFSNYFKSNRAKSATTVWVYNEFFNKGQSYFVNDQSLQLVFTSNIPLKENATVSAKLSLSPEEPVIPEVAMQLDNLEPADGSPLVYDEASGYYKFTPSAVETVLNFTTKVDDGDIKLTATTPDGTYPEPAELFPYYFGHADFEGGYYRGSKWSNVVNGHCNSASGDKLLLFHYTTDHSDPDNQPAIFLTAPNGDALPKSGNKYTLPGVVTINKGSAMPWKPSGRFSVTSDITYQELQILSSTGSIMPVKFNLCSNGYVDMPVTSTRFAGDVIPFEATNAANSKLNYKTSGSPTVTKPTFSVTMWGKSCKFTFDKISAMQLDDEAVGVVLNKGESYKLTVESTTTDFYVTMVRIGYYDKYTWGGVTQMMKPSYISCEDGQSRWDQSTNNVQVVDVDYTKKKKSVEITIQAADHPVIITSLVSQTAKLTSLYDEDGVNILH